MHSSGICFGTGHPGARRCQEHRQTLKGLRLLFSAPLRSSHAFHLPEHSFPQQQGATGSVPCTQPQQGLVALATPCIVPSCPAPN